MDYTLLGKRIRDERLIQRLTLEKLAEKIDKSINFIGQIERGEGKPSLETLVDIANALGVSVDYLLYDNIKVSADDTDKEILGIIHMMDDKGKRFILDIAERYIYYHNKNNNP